MKDVRTVKTIKEVLEIKNAKTISYKDGLFTVYTDDIPNGKYMWALEEGAHTYDGGVALSWYMVFDSLEKVLKDLLEHPYPWNVQVARVKIH